MRNFKIEKDFILDGYRCLIVGQAMGHRCGYVGLIGEHAMYGKHYDDIDIDVHGGLTYSEGNSTYPVNSNLWWIGFDCAHYCDAKDFDLIAELNDEKLYNRLIELEKEFPTGGVIRTTEYVEQELIKMVEQLKNMQ